MQAQRAGGAMRSTAQFSLGVRLENAMVAYAMYLWKMIWPSHLAPIYPHPGDSLAGWQVGTSALVLLAVTGVALQVPCEAISADGLAVVSWDSGSRNRPGAGR